MELLPINRCLLSRMKISYRITSVVVLVVTAGLFAVPDSLTVRPSVPSTGPEHRASAFDPCSMWIQMGLLVQLVALVWIGTLLSLWVQGLRNRTLPRIVAIVSLVALGFKVRNEAWRAPCYSNTAIGLSAIWVTAVALMCLHHLLQRPAHGETVAASSWGSSQRPVWLSY
jgi:hypothetical protein